jgi:hypothetical protein
LATTETSKIAVRARKASARKGGLKLVGRKTGHATVGYSYSGPIRDLSKALEESHVSKGVRAVVIPDTIEAETALKRGRRFKPIGFGKMVVVRTGRKGVMFADAKPVKVELVNGVMRAITAPEASQASIESEAFQPDARARAILRGVTYAAEDLKAAGGAYEIDEVRALLNGVTRQAIDKKVKLGELLAVPGPSGRRRFPTFQFNTDRTLVVGLKEVHKALCFSSPWAVLNFLVNGNERLGGERPIDFLRKGAVDRVVAAAETGGVQGA